MTGINCSPDSKNLESFAQYYFRVYVRVISNPYLH